MTKRNKNIMVKSKKMICQIKNTKEASRRQLNDILIFDRKNA